ncbi:MAG: FHA domain-containing protein, partial [bacterium]
MLYRLILLTGPNTGQQLTVLSPCMTIGSGPDCTVRISDSEMAGRHAQLEQTETGLMIRDLGTMHKILVNHHQVEQCLLKHGDEIEIGMTRFLVHATVKAEVNSHQPVEGLQRSGQRPRLLIKLVYAAAGVALLYLMARPFLILPEASDETESAPSKSTNSPVLPIATGTNLLPRPVGAGTNTSPRINTVTNLPVPTNAAVRPPAAPETRPLVDVLPPTSPATNPSPAATPVPREQPAAARSPVPSGKVIRILSVTSSKFPATDAYDEMRTFTISLQQALDAEIDPDSVSLDVRFFDVRNRNTGD